MNINLTFNTEIENAIKHHITINIDEDPEYYKAFNVLKTIEEQKKNGKI